MQSGCSCGSFDTIATRAGVSLGTVSNVLNRPDQVSERTRDRVHAAIEALGFVRNESARRLRGSRSRTLAYVVLSTTNPFFTDVADGAQAAADAAGLALYLCNSGGDARRQQTYLDLLEQQRAEGVLLTPVDPADPRIAAVAGRGTPVVVVARGGVATPGVSSVSVDDVVGGDLAATHLLDAGHRHLAFVGPSRDRGRPADRLLGGQRAVDRSGGDLTVLETDGYDIADGRRAGERLAGIPAARRPSAVFCGNDLVALGLLQRVVRLGLRVPDDVAIVGYDDIAFAEAATVPLTTVAQPRHRLGRTAVELLLDQVRDGATPRHVVFEPQLVVRASTRLPAAHR